MHIFVQVLITLIALFHTYVFIMESILWKTPRAMKVFGTTPETATSSHKLAINQGVYNLFLVAGLVWSLVATSPINFQLQLFFLSCIIVAAATAGLVISKRIMLIQGTPALIALVLVILAH